MILKFARLASSQCPSYTSSWKILSLIVWLSIIVLQQGLSADIEGCPVGIKISVIHNALIWPEQDWPLLIKFQLNHLVEIGIVDCANIHVALSIPAISPNLTYEALEELLDEGRQLVQEILPIKRNGRRNGVVVSQVHENSFEYPGLHLLYLLAQEVTEDDQTRHVFLYFHTKGMVNHGHHIKRPQAEAELFYAAIVPWREIVDVFAKNASVTRCGSFPSPGGWMWQNFWWARASYIQTLVEPIRTTRRHYYEDWLGRQYHESTKDSPEPGLMGGCATCYSINGNCSGYGIIYEPKDLRWCNNPGSSL